MTRRGSSLIQFGSNDVQLFILDLKNQLTTNLEGVPEGVLGYLVIYSRVPLSHDSVTERQAAPYMLTHFMGEII